MTFPDRDELEEVLELVAQEARSYVASVDDRPVRSPRTREALEAFNRALPEHGSGASQALRELIDQGLDATVASSGPRCFHFVIGGATPAALAADWWTSALDQIAYAWVSSPLSVELERVALAWLLELFELPASFSGVMTTGATMANFVGLASARQWWSEEMGLDAFETGLAGAPPVPIFCSRIVHASATKCLGMLGLGRATPEVLAREGSNILDVSRLERALDELGDRPAIVMTTAGDPNAGEFDPIAEVAELLRGRRAWLHVDGAFGLFARLDPTTAELVRGVEHADSVAVDGHKWLNVPYDCGFGFVRDRQWLGKSFRYQAEYLPDDVEDEPVLGQLGPESSRRARALSVWATLRAYGREGYRELVTRHCALARRMARLVDEAPDLERLADVTLNVVCFRYDPGGSTEEELDRLNAALGRALIEDGRFYVGSTTFRGRVALRPALSNWRTREEDVDAFVEVVRELGGRLGREARP